MSVLIKDTTYANETTPIWTSSALYRQPVGTIDPNANSFVTKACPTGTITSMFTQPVAGTSLLPSTSYQVVIPIDYGSTTAGTYGIIIAWQGSGSFAQYSVFMNGTNPVDSTTASVVLTTPANPVSTLSFSIIHDNGGSPNVSLGVNAGEPGICVKQW